MQLAQAESDEIMHNAEDFRVRSKLAMNKEWTAHQAKILEFNERAKQFAAHQEQFEVDEAQRWLCEAEWQQREKSEQLRALQCSLQLAQQTLAAGKTAMPTAPPRPKPPLPPRMEQAATSVH